jgi:hypothetical protein
MTKARFFFLLIFIALFPLPAHADRCSTGPITDACIAAELDHFIKSPAAAVDRQRKPQALSILIYLSTTQSVEPQSYYIEQLTKHKRAAAYVPKDQEDQIKAAIEAAKRNLPRPRKYSFHDKKQEYIPLNACQKEFEVARNKPVSAQCAQLPVLARMRTSMRRGDFASAILLAQQNNAQATFAQDLFQLSHRREKLLIDGEEIYNPDTFKEKLQDSLPAVLGISLPKDYPIAIALVKAFCKVSDMTNCRKVFNHFNLTQDPEAIIQLIDGYLQTKSYNDAAHWMEALNRIERPIISVPHRFGSTQKQEFPFNTSYLDDIYGHITEKQFLDIAIQAQNAITPTISAAATLIATDKGAEYARTLKVNCNNETQSLQDCALTFYKAPFEAASLYATFGQFEKSAQSISHDTGLAEKKLIDAIQDTLLIPNNIASDPVKRAREIKDRQTVNRHHIRLALRTATRIQKCDTSKIKEIYAPVIIDIDQIIDVQIDTKHITPWDKLEAQCLIKAHRKFASFVQKFKAPDAQKEAYLLMIKLLSGPEFSQESLTNGPEVFELAQSVPANQPDIKIDIFRLLNKHRFVDKTHPEEARQAQNVLVRAEIAKNPENKKLPLYILDENEQQPAREKPDNLILAQRSKHLYAGEFQEMIDIFKSLPTERQQEIFIDFFTKDFPFVMIPQKYMTQIEMQSLPLKQDDRIDALFFMIYQKAAIDYFLRVFEKVSTRVQ